MDLNQILTTAPVSIPVETVVATVTAMAMETAQPQKLDFDQIISNFPSGPAGFPFEGTNQNLNLNLNQAQNINSNQGGNAKTATPIQKIPRATIVFEYYPLSELPLSISTIYGLPYDPAPTNSQGSGDGGVSGINTLRNSVEKALSVSATQSDGVLTGIPISTNTDTNIPIANNDRKSDQNGRKGISRTEKGLIAAVVILFFFLALLLIYTLLIIKRKRQRRRRQLDEFKNKNGTSNSPGRHHHTDTEDAEVLPSHYKPFQDNQQLKIRHGTTEFMGGNIGQSYQAAEIDNYNIINNTNTNKDLNIQNNHRKGPEFPYNLNAETLFDDPKSHLRNSTDIYSASENNDVYGTRSKNRNAASFNTTKSDYLLSKIESFKRIPLPIDKDKGPFSVEYFKELEKSRSKRMNAGTNKDGATSDQSLPENSIFIFDDIKPSRSHIKANTLKKRIKNRQKSKTGYNSHNYSKSENEGSIKTPPMKKNGANTTEFFEINFDSPNYDDSIFQLSSYSKDPKYFKHRGNQNQNQNQSRSRSRSKKSGLGFYSDSEISLRSVIEIQMIEQTGISGPPKAINNLSRAEHLLQSKTKSPKKKASRYQRQSQSTGGNRNNDIFPIMEINQFEPPHEDSKSGTKNSYNTINGGYSRNGRKGVLKESPTIYASDDHNTLYTTGFNSANTRSVAQNYFSPSLINNNCRITNGNKNTDNMVTRPKLAKTTSPGYTIDTNFIPLKPTPINSSGIYDENNFSLSSLIKEEYAKSKHPAHSMSSVNSKPKFDPSIVIDCSNSELLGSPANAKNQELGISQNQDQGLGLGLHLGHGLGSGSDNNFSVLGSNFTKNINSSSKGNMTSNLHKEMVEHINLTTTRTKRRNSLSRNSRDINGINAENTRSNINIDLVSNSNINLNASTVSSIKIDGANAKNILSYSKLFGFGSEDSLDQKYDFIIRHKPSLGPLVAVEPYNPQLNDELELGKGHEVYVIGEFSDGWILAVNHSDGGKIGMIPRKCVFLSNTPLSSLGSFVSN